MRIDGYIAATSFCPAISTRPLRWPPRLIPLQNDYGVVRGAKYLAQASTSSSQSLRPNSTGLPVLWQGPEGTSSLIFEVMVALVVFASIEREARRVVEASKAPLVGTNPDRRDHLPVTTAVLFEAFRSLTLVKQRIQSGDDIHDLIVPTSLHWVQVAVLDRLDLTKPDAYPHTVRSSHHV